MAKIVAKGEIFMHLTPVPIEAGTMVRIDSDTQIPQDSIPITIPCIFVWDQEFLDRVNEEIKRRREVSASS